MMQTTVGVEPLQVPLEERTTIAITKVTKERLAKWCAKDDTYEQIIRRILDFYESQKK